MYQYDPLRVTTVWAGIPMQGFQDGTFVKVEYDEEAVKKTVGSQGTVTATINGNRSGKVTVTLVQGSTTNTLLSPFAASVRPRGSALIVKPLLIKDLNGDTICSAAEAWIMKLPDVEFGKEALGREWVFECAELSVLVGGSLRVSP